MEAGKKRSFKRRVRRDARAEIKMQCADEAARLEAERAQQEAEHRQYMEESAYTELWMDDLFDDDYDDGPNDDFDPVYDNDPYYDDGDYMDYM